jgi:hypothetical protein
MMKKFYWTLATLIAGLAFAAAPAEAQNLTCTSTVNPTVAVTFANVSVPANASCTLDSTVTVTGNVTAGAGATLFINAAIVEGNVVSIDGARFEIEPLTTIDGNVVVVGFAGTGPYGGVQIINATITGNVTISGSTSGFIVVNTNVIGTNLMVSGNTTTGLDNDVITSNTIGGNFVCNGNTPPAINPGPPNRVAGTNQCRL